MGMAKFKQRVQEQEERVDPTQLDLSEALCLKCGICCHTKAWKLDMSCAILPGKCHFLSDVNHCLVYSHRHTFAPNCTTIKDALLACILPLSCGYVQKNWEQIKTWYLFPEIRF